MIKAFVEIKNRIFLSIITALSVFLIAYYYKTFILTLIIVSNSKLSNEVLNYFIFTSITELFSIYLTLSFILATQVLYFVLIYHVICFLASGLYKLEYRYLTHAFFVATMMAVLSLYIFHEIIIPVLTSFFLSFQNHTLKNVSFYFEAKIFDYLLFYKDTYLSCFLSSQGCVFLILLSNFISTNLDLLRSTRKFIYLILLIFSTAVTPPDVFSQLFLFLGLLSVFEILIFLNILKTSRVGLSISYY